MAKATHPTLPALGIDIAKKSFAASLLLNGNIVARGQFDNDTTGFAKLATWLAKHLAQTPHTRLHACMEATGRYARALHRFLFEQGHTVSVVNPQRTCNFVKSRMARTKSDKADADAIAWFCASQKPEPTPPLPPEKLQLQDITRRIHDLKQERQRERNRLKAGLEAAAVERDIKQNLKRIEERLKVLEKEAKQLLAEYPELAEQVTLLMSIKGIAFITAVILVAEIPDVHAFARVGQLVAYAGLNPTHITSGTSVKKKSHLSKQGNSHIRAGLYMPILSAIRFNPHLKTLALRLKAEGRHKMVINGAAMRKMLHIVYGVLKSRKPYDPNYAFAA